MKMLYVDHTEVDTFTQFPCDTVSFLPSVCVKGFARVNEAVWSLLITWTTPLVSSPVCLHLHYQMWAQKQINTDHPPVQKHTSETLSVV